jgi:hypothetical protein
LTARVVDSGESQLLIDRVKLVTWGEIDPAQHIQAPDRIADLFFRERWTTPLFPLKHGPHNLHL